MGQVSLGKTRSFFFSCGLCYDFNLQLLLICLLKHGLLMGLSNCLTALAFSISWERKHWAKPNRDIRRGRKGGQSRGWVDFILCCQKQTNTFMRTM